MDRIADIIYIPSVSLRSGLVYVNVNAKLTISVTLGLFRYRYLGKGVKHILVM